MPSVFSANAVIMPKNADTHIQKIAPGPPMASAVATPAMLPVPAEAASAVHMAAKGETACAPPARRPAPPKQDSRVLRSHSPQCRSWNTWVRRVKYSPVPTSSASRGGPQSRARAASFARVSISINMADPSFASTICPRGAQNPAMGHCAPCTVPRLPL